MSQSLKNSTKKRILVLHPALAPYRLDFFNSLAENFDSKFYFYNRNLISQKFNQAELIKEINFKIDYLKGFILFKKYFRFGILKVVKRERPDIVLGSEFNMVNMFVILSRFVYSEKFKIYIISDDNVDVVNRQSIFKKAARRFILRYIEGIVLTNIEIAEWYHNQLGFNKRILIFPIIRDEKKFITNLDNCNQFIDDYKDFYRLKGKKVLLFVGRLVEVKNLFVLIKAFNEIRKRDDSVVLSIVGSGVLERALKDEVNLLGLSDSVIIPGRKEGPGLLAWYRVADFFILPSTYEPFGAVVNEALLAGCYTIVSDKVGAKSLIVPGVNGQIFDPYNVDSLVSAIEESIAHDKMGALFNNKKSRMIVDFNTFVVDLVKEFKK